MPLKDWGQILDQLFMFFDDRVKIKWRKNWVLSSKLFLNMKKMKMNLPILI
jgi:hypothetical protein